MQQCPVARCCVPHNAFLRHWFKSLRMNLSPTGDRRGRKHGEEAAVEGPGIGEGGGRRQNHVGWSKSACYQVATKETPAPRSLQKPAISKHSTGVFTCQQWHLVICNNLQHLAFSYRQCLQKQIMLFACLKKCMMRCPLIIECRQGQSLCLGTLP